MYQDCKVKVDVCLVCGGRDIVVESDFDWDSWCSGRESARECKYLKCNKCGSLERISPRKKNIRKMDLEKIIEGLGEKVDSVKGKGLKSSKGLKKEEKKRKKSLW